MTKLAFLLIAIIGLTVASLGAARDESLTIELGQARTARTAKFSVNFLEMVEDSRCPADVNCIWAGVARIKVRISRSGKSTDVELNTMDKKTATFRGYVVSLTDLKPHQSTTSKYSPSAYSVTIKVSKAGS